MGLIEKDGKKYLDLGNGRAVRVNEAGEITDIQVEERVDKNGRQDVVVHVPCLQIVNKATNS